MMFTISKEKIKNAVKAVSDYYFGDKALFKEALNSKEKNLQDVLLLSVESFLSDDIESLTKFIHQLIPLLPINMQELLAVRWKGNFEIFRGDYSKAKELLENALQIAKQSDVDKWLIRDIVLDLRNLSVLKSDRNKILSYNEEFSKELNEYDDWNYAPFIDGGLFKAYEVVLENLITKFTDGPNTIRLSDQTIPSTFDHLAEAICFALCYGSYTYLRVIRSRLGNLFYVYSHNYDSFDLLKEALKLYALETKIGLIKKILTTDKERIYAGIAGEPNNLIDYVIPKKNDDQSKIVKCVFIEALGNYIQDENLPEIINFLSNCITGQFSLDESIDLKRPSLQALAKVVERANLLEVIPKINNLIGDDVLVNHEILEILEQVSWENTPKELALNVAKKLVEKKLFIRNPQLFYKVLQEIRIVHGTFDLEYEKSLLDAYKTEKSLDSIFYFSKLIKEDYLEDRKSIAFYLLEKIETINNEVSKNAPKVFSIGGYDDLYLYYEYAHRGIYGDIDKAVELYKKILTNPNQLYSVKHECLNHILVLRNQGNELARSYGQNIADYCFSNNDSTHNGIDKGIFPENHKEKYILELYQFYLIYQQKFSFDEVIITSSEYLVHEKPGVRSEALNFLKEVINKSPELEKNALLELLYVKTYDSSEFVRSKAIGYLSEFIVNKKQWEGICIRRMKILIRDNSDFVRNEVLIAAQKNIKKSEDNGYYSIIKWAKFDPHYIIRNRAKKALLELGEK